MPFARLMNVADVQLAQAKKVASNIKLAQAKKVASIKNKLNKLNTTATPVVAIVLEEDDLMSMPCPLMTQYSLNKCSAKQIAEITKYV